jgi:hypothetical protein
MIDANHTPQPQIPCPVGLQRFFSGSAHHDRRQPILTKEHVMRIIPIQPEPDQEAVGDDIDRTPTTFGATLPSRRTFGAKFPSRRTFGGKFPSRRTFGGRFPSRRTFGSRFP